MASTPLISPAEAMKALFIRSHLYKLTLSRKKKINLIPVDRAKTHLDISKALARLYCFKHFHSKKTKPNSKTFLGGKQSVPKKKKSP